MGHILDWDAKSNMLENNIPAGSGWYVYMTWKVAIILEMIDWNPGGLHVLNHGKLVYMFQTHTSMQRLKKPKGTWNLVWKGFEKDSAMGSGQMGQINTNNIRQNNLRWIQKNRGQIPLTIYE